MCVNHNTRTNRQVPWVQWAECAAILIGTVLAAVPMPCHGQTLAGVPIAPPPAAPQAGSATAVGSGPVNYQIPLKGRPEQNRVQGSAHDGTVSLVARDAALGDVLATLAELNHINIVCSSQQDVPLTLALTELPFEQALNAVVATANCNWTESGGIVYVTGLSAETKVAPRIQGRQVRIFHLDFLAAADVEPGIKTLLSPVGTSYVMSRSPDDNRKTVESIVIEDVPQYLDRVQQYIRQIDQPPRQVVIEVHVLQVELEQGCRHGVDFSHMMNIAGSTVNLRVTGFATPNAPQAFFAQLSAANLQGLIDAIRHSTDAKTLAAPKVLALNGQKAQIQVGEKLGYRVLTTTQTSTMEDVQFLDVGVILEVTPTISRDSRILMNIHPKVSTGQISGDTGLPEEKTSEVTTNVLLHDGEGIVIGGLIQEDKIDTQSKLLFLGDLYVVGPLFQRRQTTNVRKETIFFLVPRIIEPGVVLDPEEQERARSPLFNGPLCPAPRPWEPPLPNCYDNPTTPHLLPHWPRRPERQCPATIRGTSAPNLQPMPPVLLPSDTTPLPTPAGMFDQPGAVQQTSYVEPINSRQRPAPIPISYPRTNTRSYPPTYPHTQPAARGPR